MKPELSIARLKLLARLSDRKVRRSEGLILVEGPKLVEEALRGGWLRELLVADEEDARRFGDLASLPLHRIGSEWMGRIATVKTPQGVLGIGTPPPTGTLQEALARHGRILVLDAVQDPGNVGVLARIARGLGVDALLLGPGTAEPFAPKVLRASAGALFHLPVYACENFEGFGAAAAASGHRLVVPVVQGGQDFRTTAAPERYLLVAGNEGSGTALDPNSPEVLPLTIPLTGDCESLNVASACAAILGRWLP